MAVITGAVLLATPDTAFAQLCCGGGSYQSAVDTCKSTDYGWECEPTQYGTTYGSCNYVSGTSSCQRNASTWWYTGRCTGGGVTGCTWDNSTLHPVTSSGCFESYTGSCVTPPSPTPDPNNPDPTDPPLSGKPYGRIIIRVWQDDDADGIRDTNESFVNSTNMNLSYNIAGIADCRKSLGFVISQASLIAENPGFLHFSDKLIGIHNTVFPNKTGYDLRNDLTEQYSYLFTEKFDGSCNSQERCYVDSANQGFNGRCVCGGNGGFWGQLAPTGNWKYYDNHRQSCRRLWQYRFIVKNAPPVNQEGHFTI